MSHAHMRMARLLGCDGEFIRFEHSPNHFLIKAKRAILALLRLNVAATNMALIEF